MRMWRAGEGRTQDRATAGDADAETAGQGAEEVARRGLAGPRRRREHNMSTMSEPVSPPSCREPRPATPGTTVVGWLLISFACIPLAMAAHGDGRAPLWVGLGMVGAGAGLVLVSRLRRRP